MDQILTWINPSYLQKQKELQRSFFSAKPFSHLVLPSFLLEERAELLREAVLRQQWHDKNTDLFQFKQTDDLCSSADPFLQEYLSFFSSPAFLSFIKQITGISPLVSIDASGQQYTSGDYLLSHDDRLEGRKVAYVMNLTKGFTDSDGGQLQFFDVDKKGHPSVIAKSSLPAFNTLFLFRVSKKSFHQVSEVVTNKQRLSITGWFYG
ncbi:2OG-Fe(II) oxygenase [Candidatus Woesearchaeota archaeon]|nr:2OG-Fe(II) oxygenase [Candidatus Woesearchaeota archaeon]